MEFLRFLQCCLELQWRIVFFREIAHIAIVQCILEILPGHLAEFVPLEISHRDAFVAHTEHSFCIYPGICLREQEDTLTEGEFDVEHPQGAVAMGKAGVAHNAVCVTVIYPAAFVKGVAHKIIEAYLCESGDATSDGW